MEKNNDELQKLAKIIPFSDVQEEDVEFLWEPYIPKGKIVAIIGDPGVSKTTLALKIACMISNGENIPFSNNSIEKGKVIFENLEDGKEDTIKPRIIKMKGNCNNIFYNSKKYKLQLTDTDRITKIVKDNKPVLFILDPIQSFIGAKTDTNKVNDIRTIFDPIIKIAHKGKCTFLIVMHLNKSSEKKALYKALGSIDFMGVSRSVLYVAQHPQNPGVLLLENIKNNLAPKGDTLSYKITSENGIEFLENLGNISIDDLYNNSPQNFSELKGKELAQKFILAELTYGEISSKILKEKAKIIGISSATFDRAKKDLPIDTYFKDEEKEYFCKLITEEKN